MQDLLRRLRQSMAWIAAQFWATLLIVLAAIAWTRLPDSYAWQVLFTLLLPLLFLLALLVLESGTMRRLFAPQDRKIHFAGSVLSLLVWVCVAALVWWFLDWCDDQTIEWASYLNSKASAGGRATLFTYDHLQHWISMLLWIARWIVLPAKLIPHAIASAQWGWRIPWIRVWKLLLNWQWWLAAIAAALLAISLPGHFYNAVPRGAVSHQIWSIGFKLAVNYFLAVVVWVLLLAWCAVLLNRAVRGKKLSAEGSETVLPVGSGVQSEG